jgi:flagellar basal body-associated protein FliL
VAEVRDTAEKILVIIIVILVLFLVLIIVAIVMIKKSGKHVPRLFQRFVKDVTHKIETKEQIFYDESKATEETAEQADLEQSENADEDVNIPEQDTHNSSEDG